MKEVMRFGGSGTFGGSFPAGSSPAWQISQPLPPIPGQLLAVHLHVKHPDGRCEGLTRRGTRCRFRACMILVRYTGGKQEGQHSACEIHRNTWRWW